MSNTKNWVPTDRDRLAFGPCMTAAIEMIKTNIEWEYSGYLDDSSGRNELARISYQLADALIHESKKPSSPPGGNGLESV